MHRTSKRFVDVIYLILIGLLCCITLYNHFEKNFELSINNYLGFAVWILTVLTFLFKHTYSHFLVLCLLLLALFNIISFTSGIYRIGFSFGNTVTADFESLSLNPIILLLLIIYGFINKSFIRSMLFNSAKDEEIERKKMINFYYEKFSTCSNEELSNICKMFNEYPEEAQIALKKLENENRISLIEK